MIIKYNGIQKIICGNLLVTPSDIICAEIDGIDYILQEIRDERNTGRVRR
jgi:regulator of RNase E activity RraA